MVESLNGLATTLRAQAHYDEAEPLLRQALALRLKLLGEEHPDVARSLESLARVLKEKGDCEAAEPFFQRAIDTFQRSLEPDHWRVARARGDYGACLTELGRFRDAEEQLLAGYGGLKAGVGEQDKRTQKAVSGLIRLYEAWGMPEKAAKHHALLKGTNQAGSRTEATKDP